MTDHLSTFPSVSVWPDTAPFSSERCSFQDVEFRRNWACAVKRPRQRRQGSSLSSSLLIVSNIFTKFLMVHSFSWKSEYLSDQTLEQSIRWSTQTYSAKKVSHFFVLCLFGTFVLHRRFLTFFWVRKWAILWHAFMACRACSSKTHRRAEK